MMNSPPFLSCVVAVYNADHFVEKQLEQISFFLEKYYPSSELIVVDDGSKDETLKKLHKVKFSGLKVYSLLKNYGQGAALKVGITASRGQFVFYTDIDLSTPLKELPVFLSVLESDADVAIGSRWKPQAKIDRNQPFWRRFFGDIFYMIVNSLYLKIKLSDTNCGFKVYKGEVARTLYGYIRCWRWAFNMEHLFFAQKLGFRIVEIPVEWNHNQESKVNIFRDIVFTLWELFLIKIRTWAGSYPKISFEK